MSCCKRTSSTSSISPSSPMAAKGAGIGGIFHCHLGLCDCVADWLSCGVGGVSMSMCGQTTGANTTVCVWAGAAGW